MKPSYRIIDYKERLLAAWSIFLVSPIISLSLYAGYWITWLFATEGSVIRNDIRDGGHIWVIAYCGSFTIIFLSHLIFTSIEYLIFRKEQDYNE